MPRRVLIMWYKNEMVDVLYKKFERWAFDIFLFFLRFVVFLFHFTKMCICDKKFSYHVKHHQIYSLWTRQQNRTRFFWDKDTISVKTKSLNRFYIFIILYITIAIDFFLCFLHRFVACWIKIIFEAQLYTVKFIGVVSVVKYNYGNIYNSSIDNYL